MELSEKDKDKIVGEISDCQGRIVQTFVPTIIAVGLISISDRENFALVTIISSFAVLFGSSLYVASLSFKIFRNASFLEEYNRILGSGKVTDWERLLTAFWEKQSTPIIIGYETRSIAVVYFVFSLAFLGMFYELGHTLILISLFAALIFVALRILFIPARAKNYRATWNDVLSESIVRKSESL